MRIVAGRHRGRPIEAPAGWDVRPTSDRVREAVFNILAHRQWRADGTSALQGASVLDGFCGTGALGLEALSRGASHVTFMDNSRAALAVCRRNLAALGEAAAADVLEGDCLRPVRPRASCTLVLLDPPYGAGLGGPALAALAAAGWMADEAVAVVETGAADPLEPPAGFEALDERRYGAARIRFFRYRNHPEPPR